EAVEALTRGLMNKFMHMPLQALKSAARDGDAAALDAIRGMFDRECGKEKSDEGDTAGPETEPGTDKDSV
ncbi:MAG: glutamyl-tRNA reductase, partial [Acidobacteriaceae bacterium]